MPISRPPDRNDRTSGATTFDALNSTLAPFERVRRFAILPRELTLEAGEITPTLKVRRRVVTEHFADLITELYGMQEGRASA